MRTERENMKIVFCNLRFSAERSGIEFYLLPTIKCILNEYGEYRPKWKIRIIWIWFCIEIKSKQYKKFNRWWRK